MRKSLIITCLSLSILTCVLVLTSAIPISVFVGVEIFLTFVIVLINMGSKK